MHRDLKLENVVRVGKDCWKLIDFGFAYHGNIDESVVKSKLGNRYGRAP
jgi:serine/threonine protein kinase